jgi:hypothetical protein
MTQTAALQRDGVHGDLLERKAGGGLADEATKPSLNDVSFCINSEI